MDSSNRSAAPTDVPVSGEPRRAARGSKRDKIVRSASKLFLEKGYDSVSMNDIIDLVGGSKGTIYSIFGSKEKLFEAVVEQLCSDVTVHIDARPVGTIEEQLTRIAKSFVARVLTPQIMSFHRLMTSIGRTFPVAGRLFYNTGPRTAYQIIAGWIAFQQRSGNIRGDLDPHRLAVLFHDMLIGDQQLSWLTSASSDKDRDKRINQTIRIAVAVFLQGCASNKGSASDQGSASATPGGTKRNGARPPARKRRSSVKS
jgi:TetR/AcrR family transcriptional regulator, mexJK operon transcriptional repressor